MPEDSSPLLRDELQVVLGQGRLEPSRHAHLSARANCLPRRWPDGMVARAALSEGFVNLWLSDRALARVLQQTLGGLDWLERPSGSVDVAGGSGEWSKLRARAVQLCLERLLDGTGPAEELPVGPTRLSTPPGPEPAMALLCLANAPRRACRLAYRATWRHNPFERLNYAIVRLRRLEPGELRYPLTGPAERALLLLLEAYPWERREAARSRRPDRLARFALETADRFHAYYSAVPILADPSRLALCRGVRIVLEACWVLLGLGCAPGESEQGSVVGHQCLCPAG